MGIIDILAYATGSILVGTALLMLLVQNKILKKQTIELEKKHKESLRQGFRIMLGDGKAFFSREEEQWIEMPTEYYHEILMFAINSDTEMLERIKDGSKELEKIEAIEKYEKKLKKLKGY